MRKYLEGSGSDLIQVQNLHLCGWNGKNHHMT